MVLMTGKDYRAKNKARMLKLRNEMAAKGYKQLTHFFSEAFRDEITRITKEQKITKTESLEYIFQGYLKNSTNTIQERYKEEPQSIEKIENNINPAPEPAQKHLEFAEPEERPMDAPPPPMDPEPWKDKEAYKTYTTEIILKLHKKGISSTDITKELETMGIKTRTGKEKWAPGTIRNIIKKNKD